MGGPVQGTLRPEDAPAEGQFALAIGSDLVPTLPQWVFPHRLLRECAFLTVARHGDALRFNPPLERLDTRLGSESTLLPQRSCELSSTEVRRRMAAGKKVAGLVAPSVMRYAAMQGLYR
jgi:nicotinate-nucleotide adenylyltransferase